MDAEKKHKFGWLAIAVLILAATVADLLSLIPFVGDIVGPIFWILAGIYFWKKGMGLLNGKRFAVSAISLVAELVPVVQELPAILAGIIAVIAITRAEEKIGINLPGMPTGNIKSATLNQEGVRMPPPKEYYNADGVRSPNGGLIPK